MKYLVKSVISVRCIGRKKTYHFCSFRSHYPKPVKRLLSYTLASLTTTALIICAVKKLAGEQYCAAFYKVYGLETVALRYFNIFSKRQDPTSYYSTVIPKFIRLFLNEQTPVINGDDSVCRDFTHIDNVIHANLLACNATKAAGQMVNIACGQRISLNELTAEPKKLTGAKVEPVHAKPRPGDVQHSLADISLAKELLGYEAQVDVYKGLKKTVEWFLQHKEALA